MNKQTFMYFLKKAEDLKSQYQTKIEEYVKTKTAEIEKKDRVQEDPEAVLKDL